MAEQSSDPTLTIENEAANRQPICYIGMATSLDVILANPGDAIGLVAGSNASMIQIFMPRFFSDTDLSKMGIDLDGWQYASQDGSLTLTYTGTGINWTSSNPIAFKITNVASSAKQPDSDNLMVCPSNMQGNVSLQIQQPLALSEPPTGNTRLRDVLQVSLDNPGAVYVSRGQDPLQNKLFLNFKNINDGVIYAGNQGETKVSVLFVYGNTSGALTSDGKDAKSDSAWKITGEVPIDQTNGWKITNPSDHDTNMHPRWLIEPVHANAAVLGTGSNANVTFSFGNIVTFTPPGHTQMMVHFSGFKQDANTPYADEIWILDIVKLEPPPTRGLLGFFGQEPLVTVTSPTQEINIPLRWSMFHVAKVHLLCSFPGVALYTKDYSTSNLPPPPLNYDHLTVKLPGTVESKAIFNTLQAYDGNGNFLNSLQFAVYIQAMAFVDPRDGQVYPAILVNNLVWMAENLRFPEAGESFVAGGNEANAARFGRLYTVNASSVKDPPAGWRMPTSADWNALFQCYGPSPYAALIAGGASGFNAQLAGYRDDRGSYTGITSYGFYRSSSGNASAVFSAGQQSTSTLTTIPISFALSVRYVKDV